MRMFGLFHRREFWIDSIRINICAGTTISTACEDASAFARQMKASVSFDFNGVELVTTGDPSEPYEKYRRHLQQRDAE